MPGDIFNCVLETVEQRREGSEEDAPLNALNESSFDAAVILTTLSGKQDDVEVSPIRPKRREPRGEGGSIGTPSVLAGTTDSGQVLFTFGNGVPKQRGRTVLLYTSVFDASKCQSTA